MNRIKAELPMEEYTGVREPAKHQRVRDAEIRCRRVIIARAGEKPCVVTCHRLKAYRLGDTRVHDLLELLKPEGFRQIVVHACEVGVTFLRWRHLSCDEHD